MSHLKKRKGERKKRYYSKTYTPKEIQLIKTLNFENVEGFFWALKESAYKVFYRIKPEKIFSPKKFEVLTFDGKLGIVKTPINQVNVEVESTEKYIHCIAYTENKPQHFGVFCFKTNFHSIIRESIAKMLNVETNEVKIIKDKNNVPTLVVNNRPYLLSLSHDFNIGAFAFI